jgi:osmoprotectant transport system substrate-binding protein
MRPFAALACIVILGLSGEPHGAAAATPVVVGSKIDTEGALLGNMIAAALQRHGIAILDKTSLGPTDLVRRAILAGQIDIYPEYTGNGARFFRLPDDPAWRDPQRGYERVKALDAQHNDLIWLAAAPASNSWTIVVRPDLAAAQGGATLDDFARYVTAGGRVRLAASAEFVESPGALPAFQATYGFTLGRSQLLVLVGGDTAATMRAAADGISGVNAAMAYGTDGALAVLRLVPLRDDKAAETIYRPAPVVRQAVLAEHPDMAVILDPIFATLTMTTLQQLNAEIVVEGRDAHSVAAAYLDGLGKPPQGVGQ